MKEQGLLPDCQKTRQENRQLRDQIHKLEVNLTDEKSGNVTAVKNHTDEGSYFQRDLDTYHRQLDDIETQRHRNAEDHHTSYVDHNYEKGDFLALTKSKEDGENEIFLKNSELLGI